MTTDSDLWRCFNVVVVNYLNPTQRLCVELAKDRLDNETLRARMAAIVSPQFSEPQDVPEFFFFGKAFKGQQNSQLRLNPCRDNLHFRFVAIANEFHARLDELGDRPDLDSARTIAYEFEVQFATLDIQELKAEVERACELLHLAQQNGDRQVLLDPFSSPASDLGPNDPISFDEIGILAGVEKKTVQNRARHWRKTHTITDPCSYAMVRPFILEAWHRKQVMFPPEYAAVREILKLRKSDSTPTE